MDKEADAGRAKAGGRKDTMGFRLGTRAVCRPSEQAGGAGHRQGDYQKCWKGLRNNFR